LPLQNRAPGLPDIEIRSGGSNAGVEIIHGRVLIQNAGLIVLRTEAVGAGVVGQSRAISHGNQVRSVEMPVTGIVAHDNEIALCERSVRDAQRVGIGNCRPVEDSVRSTSDAIVIAGGGEFTAWHAGADGLVRGDQSAVGRRADFTAAL